MTGKCIRIISQIAIVVMLFTGCGEQESQEMVSQTEQESVDALEQGTAEDDLDESLQDIGKDVSVEAAQDTYVEAMYDEEQDMSGEGPLRQSENLDTREMQDTLDKDRIIEEQSFQVELNDWGEVRFVSYKPDFTAGADPLEDVSFYLLKNEEVLYQFPYISSDHTSGYGAYFDVEFVMFMDTNGDGKNDIVIGAEYCTGAGPQGAIPHTVVRIYEDCGDYFTYNEGLSDRINEYLPWESNVLAKDIKRLIQLTNGNEPLTDYESYTGKWSVGAGYIAAYEDPEPSSRNELTCSISNGNEFYGNLFTEQGVTERIASVDDITGIITDGELFYEFTDDGWGGTGTLHIMFLPNQINVEVLNYQLAEENAIGYGISGTYEMTIRE